MIYLRIFLFVFIALMPLSASAQDTSALEQGQKHFFELHTYPEILFAGEEVSFSLQLKNTDNTPVENTSLWLRIAKDGTTYFTSSDFWADNGIFHFDYRFPSDGEYEMILRFLDRQSNEEVTIRESISVEQSVQAKEESANKRQSNFNLAVLTLFLGFVAGIILVRARGDNGNEYIK